LWLSFETASGLHALAVRLSASFRTPFAWTNPLENALLAACNRFLSKKSVS